MNQIIEVKLVKKNINFVATASLFPSCKGVGKTKKEALSKLSHSISRFISGHIKSTLSTLFSSNNYTQVVLDQTTLGQSQTLAFHLNHGEPSAQKTFLFKVPSIEQEDAPSSSIESGVELPEYDSILNKSIIAEENDAQADILELLGHDRPSQDSDEIIFGFPLNFN